MDEEDIWQDGSLNKEVEEAISAIRETGSHRFQLSIVCGTIMIALAANVHAVCQAAFPVIQTAY